MPNNVENFNENQLNLISNGVEDVSFDSTGANGDYIRMSVFDSNSNFTGRQFFSNQDIIGQTGIVQLPIFVNDVTGNIFVKPNDIMNTNGVPSGNYLLQFDFLRNVFNGDFNTGTDARFYISEISPSRKEVRLYGRSGVNTNLLFNEDFRNNFNSKIGGNDYQFNFILGLSNGRNLPIVNFTFDLISEPPTEENPTGNPSLIIRLNSPLPTNVNKFDECSIEQEVLLTQTQNIFFVSDIETVTIGNPLTIDTDFEDSNVYNSGVDDFQNKDELLISASLSEDTTQEILYSLKDNDKNLNIDYNDYENHVHFGSAVQKLKNFKTKVIELNEYFGHLSGSLSATSSTDAISYDNNSITQERKQFFEKIRNVYENFTPYEKFLYTDAQSQTTASAPGIGKNLVKSYALRESIGLDSSGEEILTTKLSNFDGFNNVYKVNAGDLDNTTVEIFNGVYLAENPPMFNYSGSVYISFLMRGTQHPQIINTNQTYGDGEYGTNLQPGLPERAHATQSIQGTDVGTGTPTVGAYMTGSNYRRFIFAASQSYWRLTNQGDVVDVGPAADLSQWVTDATSTDYEILHNYDGEDKPTLTPDYLLKSSSIAMKDESGLWGDLLYPKLTTTSSYLDMSTYRTGSFVLPAGDLFPIQITASANFSGLNTISQSSFITDITITKNNPSSSLPFSPIYHTGSNEWRDWYSGSLDSASAYDEKNIHSFETNLPEYIKTSKDYDDLKVFLSMIGEHFDKIKNYLDNQKVFYSRSYKNYNETGSKQLNAPDEVLPMLASNLGWEFINPYTGSLEEYFNVVSDGGDKLENIKFETWRKVLNNLMYIYKTKGTLNSVNALLNTYGYPEDSLRIQELGGSTEEINPVVLSGKVQNDVRHGFSRQTGSIHSVKSRNILRSFNFRGDKQIHLDWHTNKAKASTLEFVFKATNTGSATQTLVESSGSGTLTGSSTLWDVRLVPSSSTGTGSSIGFLEFRLNNSLTGSLDIAQNAYSMSTGYLPIADGRLWNVMIQRGTTSKVTPNSDSILQSSMSYFLYTGLQQGDKITHFTSASMTLNGGDVDGTFSASNANFTGTGSLTTAPGSASSAVSGNLIIGRTLTGSMGEVRAWGEVLSASKFQQHILNKFSTVGNTLSSSKDDLAYRFRLNENYTSASMSDTIFDANPHGLSRKEYKTGRPATDYSRPMNVFGGSYTTDFIENVGFSLRLGGLDQKNDHKALVEPELQYVRQLNPSKPSVRTVYDKPRNQQRTRRVPNKKIEIVKSPTEKIDDYLINNFSDMDISSLIGAPENKYSSSYKELDTFREFAYQGIKIDINEYIDANAVVFEDSIVNNITSLLPASTRLNSVGIMIKPTIIERNKHKYHKAQVFYGTGSGVGYYESNVFHMYYENSGSSNQTHNKDLYIFSMTGSSYEKPYELKSPLYMSSYNGSGSRDDYVFDMSQSSFTQPYDSINPIYFGGDSGSYFNLTTGSQYITQYGEQKPLYMYSDSSGSLDDYAFSMTQSIFSQPYNVMEPVQLRIRNSGSYYYTFTGSQFISNFESNGLQFYYENSGSTTNYIFNLTASSFHQPYLSNDLQLRIRNSGSYYYTFSGSKYFEQYNQKSPLYMYSYKSGSVDDYLFNTSESEFLQSYNSLNPIYFGGDSGSYFYTTTGSFLSQYNMKEPIYLKNKDSGSAVFDFTGSEYFTSYNPTDLIYLGGGESGSSNITTGSFISMYKMSETFYMSKLYNTSSGVIDLSGSKLHTPSTGSTREIADTIGLNNIMRKTRTGEKYSSNASYVWNAVGTGTDDVQFMHGTSSHGYYNQDFEFKLIGDIEIFSSSLRRTSDTLNGHKAVVSELDYSNIHAFKNKNIVDRNKGFNHKAYFPLADGVDSSSFTDGRPMGRTHYFVTGSDGAILYPPNHYLIAGTSKNCFGEGTDYQSARYYVGSQHPVPDKFGIREGGVLIDPTNVPQSTTGSVDVQEVVGSFTDQAVTVINNSGDG